MTEARDPHVATKGGDAAEAPSFDDFPYPASYGRPDRSHLKKALWAYVLGHDRGWEAERKRRQGEARVAEEEREKLREPAPPGGRAGAGEDSSAALAEAAEEDLPEASIRHTRFGVPVPERLDFHRGPDTWRRRLDRRREGSERRPGTAR